MPCVCQPGCTKMVRTQTGLQCDICKQKDFEISDLYMSERTIREYTWRFDYRGELQIHICEPCFNKHILKLLESLGVEFRWD